MGAGSPEQGQRARGRARGSVLMPLDSLLGRVQGQTQRPQSTVFVLAVQAFARCARLDDVYTVALSFNQRLHPALSSPGRPGWRGSLPALRNAAPRRVRFPRGGRSPRPAAFGSLSSGPSAPELVDLSPLIGGVRLRGVAAQAYAGALTCVCGTRGPSNLRTASPPIPYRVGASLVPVQPGEAEPPARSTGGGPPWLVSAVLLSRPSPGRHAQAGQAIACSLGAQPPIGAARLIYVDRVQYVQTER